MIDDFDLFGLFVFVFFQQFGKILDVEIIFNERGSKVCIRISFLCMLLNAV